MNIRYKDLRKGGVSNKLFLYKLFVMASKFEWTNVGAADFIEAYNEKCGEDGFFPKDDSMIFIFKFKPEYSKTLDELGFSKAQGVTEQPGRSIIVNWDVDRSYEVDGDDNVYLSFFFLDYRGDESEEFIMSYFDKSMLIGKEAVE